MFSRRVSNALVLLGALLCLALILPSALADSNVRIVRISYIDGDVQMDRRDGRGYDRAIMNMPVTQGNRLWTRGDTGLAEVEFEDGSTVRLAPESVMEFQELALRGSGQRTTSVDVQQGTVYFNIGSHAGNFRVTVAGQELTVPHDSQFRLDADKGQIKVAVDKGDVEIRSGSQNVKVKKNETFTMDLSDPSRYYLAKGLVEDRYDSWNQERSQYRDNYASTSYSSNYASYSPYYTYGVSDLNYYGSYFYAPGWGYVWQPFGMRAGWDPFMDGAWAWYPGYGYMWVSSYPWGWMPYRYGAWNFVPGYGWCWIPGRSWNNWVAYTPVQTVPRGWVAPRPPATPPPAGGTGTVPVGKGWTTILPSNLGKPGSHPRVVDDGRFAGHPKTGTVTGATATVPTAAATTSATAGTTTTTSKPSTMTVAPTTTPKASPAPTPRTHVDVDSSRGMGSSGRGSVHADMDRPQTTGSQRSAPKRSPPPPKQQFTAPAAPRMSGGFSGQMSAPHTSAPPASGHGSMSNHR